MPVDTVQKSIGGRSAVKLAESIEEAVRAGELAAGEPLPSIRGLARARRLSPGTVASAYQLLQARGIVVADGRRGTRVAHRPLYRAVPPTPVPAGVRDLSDGNPDPALLPDLGPALRAIDPAPELYAAPHADAGLRELVVRDLRAEGVRVGEIAVVSGALDGIERVLAEHLRPGDRVGVEDPGFGNFFDLVLSRGLSLVPIAHDAEGLLPSALDRACRAGLDALIVTPRVQNPSGSALTRERAAELVRILDRHPDVLLIEDDHAGLVTDAPLNVLHGPSRARWMHVRSFSKALNPDLRLAVMTGDERTIQRVIDRMIVGSRWVSHILQRTARALLGDRTVRRQIERAARVYTERRTAFRRALEAHGTTFDAPSGFNVVIPVEAELASVQALLADGWLVAPGERFRLESAPMLRITVATLQAHEAEPLAAALARVLRGGRPLATT